MFEDSALSPTEAIRNRPEFSFTQNDNLISEEAFRALVNVERKRSERSGKPFMVMVIDIAEVFHMFGKGRNAKNRAESQTRQIVNTLHGATREIDIKGWYKAQQTIGIIFTEINKNSRFSIIEKVKGNITSNVEADCISKIGISSYWFPTDLQSVDSNYNQMFYPDFSRSSLLNRSAMAAKRSLDLVGSIIGIIMFFPVFLMIPVLIKLTSRGPVFFRQERVGKGGKVFRIYKFRTMTVNNNESTHKEYMKQFIKGCAEQVSDESGQKVFKLANDSRVTKIGKFLRKTSLDEVPQFLNVVLGDMSLVGPRPPIPYEVEEYDLWHRRRVLEVKPGITGYWQLEGRSTTNFETMVRMDLHYIRKWSLAMDIKMIFKTPFVLITNRGAY